MHTGGSANLKKSFAIAAKHPEERYNQFCATALNYDRRDELLQIGRPTWEPRDASSPAVSRGGRCGSSPRKA